MTAAYQYRITKYDPAYRDAAGHYTLDEWYLHSQIGEVFGGVTLTEKEYLQVESAYVTAALHFHDEAGQPNVFAVGVEDHKNLGAPMEGALIPRELLPEICRAMLREEYWCRIEGGDFFIHFGWDYYMYVGASTPCPASLAQAQDLHLFPEPLISPYHPS